MCKCAQVFDAPSLSDSAARSCRQMHTALPSPTAQVQRSSFDTRRASRLGQASRGRHGPHPLVINTSESFVLTSTTNQHTPPAHASAPRLSPGEGRRWRRAWPSTATECASSAASVSSANTGVRAQAVSLSARRQEGQESGKGGRGRGRLSRTSWAAEKLKNLHLLLVLLVVALLDHASISCTKTWLVLSTSALYPANSSNDTGSHTREQTDGFTAQRPGRTACCARQGAESGRRASPRWCRRTRW
jgi:hypothetical protein